MFTQSESVFFVSCASRAWSVLREQQYRSAMPGRSFLERFAMGEKTDIQWCDSTLNLQMGCDGCELWENKPNGRKSCYAGILTEQYSGHPGFPKAFNQPVIYPERMNKAEKWKDLTGTNRIDKPQLNGSPRIIFLNDMGDGFTRLLDLDWMAPYIPRMEKTPHIYMMLTKRVKRMAEFWKNYGEVPDNIWLGTTITANENKKRGYDLIEISAKTKFISMEPLIESVSISEMVSNIQQVIIGFESGVGCRPGNPDWMRIIRDECSASGTAFFVKQMGGIRDHKGEIKDLPEDLRIRQIPSWNDLQWKGKYIPEIQPSIPEQLHLI
jgi:protein gp37